MKKSIKYFLFFQFTILLFCTLKINGQKTDTIYHMNGNILTGDLKSLTYGVATWKMDGMGTISLEEVKINTIISNKQFEIKLKNDEIYYGSFLASYKPRTVFIETPQNKVLVKIDDLVEVYPIKNSFWLRTYGNFSLGLNYSKGSDIATLSWSGNLNYRKKSSFFKISWDSNNTYQGDTLSTRKSDASISFERLFQRGWSSQALIGLNQNTELGTKARWAIDLIGIKDLKYSSMNRFYIGAGLSALRERPFGNGETENDLSGIIQAVWKLYKYTSPKIWVDTDISFLPYLTDNRYRAVFNLNPRVSVFSDNFKVGLAFYYNYDSNPSAGAQSNDDYGLNLQLSYYLH
ncbi:DUF481 domain-containing protein [Namhaeicola litoreus]|uniref:DUF481 domain-containing protein n=1 Tax=Namhaeicola litoreus TaxID=1052145 RepID=A0ABW3Y4G2_9FLAO